jgi:hypothetical protein
VGVGVAVDADTYVFQLPDLTRQNPHMFIIILTLEFIQYRSAILASRIGRCGSVGIISAYAIPAPTGI